MGAIDLRCDTCHHWLEHTGGHGLCRYEAQWEDTVDYHYCTGHYTPRIVPPPGPTGKGKPLAAIRTTRGRDRGWDGPLGRSASYPLGPSHIRNSNPYHSRRVLVSSRIHRAPLRTCGRG